MPTSPVLAEVSLGAGPSRGAGRARAGEWGPSPTKASPQCPESSLRGAEGGPVFSWGHQRGSSGRVLGNGFAGQAGERTLEAGGSMNEGKALRRRA